VKLHTNGSFCQLTFLVFAILITGLSQGSGSAAWIAPDAPVETRVAALLSTLTLEEKVALCHGSFTSGGIPRLGIAPLQMRDGRQGVRPVKEERGTSTTLLPCALSLACTWDEEAAREFGTLLAEEMLALHHHVLLAPNLDLVRTPLGGRNFEDLGEDPYLAGRMGCAYIGGVQEQGVGACACLMAANDNEFRRHFTSSNMDERTLRELHLRPYEMSVRDGKVWSMMSGNNMINGVYCSQNKHLIQELVKDTFGFDGVMITDWRAAYETTPTAIAGTDMTTGFCSYVFGDGRLHNAVTSGTVTMSQLDDKVRRILRLYTRAGVLDPATRRKGSLNTPEHREAARRLAAQGMVLLKNDRQLLPLDSGKLRKMLLTGPAANRVLQGGGSGSVPAEVSVSPLQGLQSALKGRAEVQHIPYAAVLRLAVEKGSVEWDAPTTAGAKKRPQKKREISAAANDMPALLEAAKSADVVVFAAAGPLGSEGQDLPDMNLPGAQAEAIAAVAKVNPNTIVVLVSNGPVSLSGWADQVPALLSTHYSGEMSGDALADVLIGRSCPEGKLPYTFARRLEDYPCHALKEWPARLRLDKDPVDPGMSPETRRPLHAFDADYREGVFAGYRWFDEKNIEPAFPFGFGLAYTTFELSDAAVRGDTNGQYRVSCTVKNTGKRLGAEVVQLYVAPRQPSVKRPPKELKAFSKVRLEPGQSRAVDLVLPPNAFAFYDEPTRQWKVDGGEYDLLIGTSSRDIKLTSTVTLKPSSLPY
jgi:beta-glucosidase